jgi:hypothetical protein
VRIPWTGLMMRLCCAVTTGLILAATLPAAATAAPTRKVREVYVSMPGADVPGPSSQDRIHVLKVGSARAVNPACTFQTGLTHGTVNTAARGVVAQSRITSATYAENEAVKHLHPLFASPDKNTFLETVTPFLNRLGER